jgi:signal transduction histidine kinase
MSKLRWLYLTDGIFLLICGCLLAGWSNSISGMDLLGMRSPGDYGTHLPEWRAISFAGEFGAAYIAFGFATLAIFHTRDERVYRASIPYFLAAHFFLSVLVWGKQLAFGPSPWGLWILAIALYPLAGFLYAFFAQLSLWWICVPRVSDDELRIREAAGQQERSRLAQDLHDSVKQQIYAIQTNLATAQVRWNSDNTASQEAVERARSTAHDAMAEMTAMLDRLRKDPVEDVGLVEALRRQSEALQYQSGAEVASTFGSMPSPDRFPATALNTIFRIAQEAMANIARHARASHVKLHVGMNEDQNAFLMTITDDGQGFDPLIASQGMGLANIRERAAEMGGSAEITASVGEGCTVELYVPLLDRRRQQLARHNGGLLVSLIILVPVSLLTGVWVEARTYLIPLAALAGVLTIFHAVAAGALKWRAH